METKNGIATLHATSREIWRKWLSEHHQSEQSIWLIIYRKKSGIPSVYYPEAVDEALCFGWIDSKPNKRDEVSYYQFFSKRNPKSNWSKVNKNKVSLLIEQGLMMPAGIAMVELAKKTGTWAALEQVDALTMPDELFQLFSKYPTAYTNWENFPPSARRGILEWVYNAKRPETRTKRIVETVLLD